MRKINIESDAKEINFPHGNSKNFSPKKGTTRFDEVC
jgi:hypothetical protein